MRVITGTARGAKLTTLEGIETRPTSERVKEAVFSMIQFEIEGRRVLDLFAGSGQLGIEALSRGAQSALFIDANVEAVQIIKQNLINTKLFERATVLSSDFEPYLAHSKSVFDIAFIDPPYGKGLAEKALIRAAGLMSEHGIVIVETDKKDELPLKAGNLTQRARKNYGKTAISVYRSEEVTEV